MPFFLIFTLFFSIASATENQQEFEYSDTPQAEQKIIYLNYHDTPEQLFNGERFSITLKTLSTESIFDDIVYTFTDGINVKVLNTIPRREIKAPYFYDTFDLVATGKKLRTPNITAFLEYNAQHRDHPTVITGKKIPIVTLNESNKFSSILATSLLLNNYKTTSYDKQSNILVFTLEAENSDIKAFKLKNIEKQGFESVEENRTSSRMTYYAIINKSLEYFEFSYYNLSSNSFKNILIPILVTDDSVSTQSDIKPIENEHLIIKIAAVISVIMILLILFYYRRKFLYLFIIIFPLSYLIMIAIPSKIICLKPNSSIHLLPMKNSTIFDVTTFDENFKVLGTSSNFSKIEHNSKIGWIDNENICTN